MASDLRIDDLARTAGVPTTTVRLYASKGLLPPPRMVGRTGYYDDHHLHRLEVIARLQDQGFSLAGIGRLLERWADGGDLAGLLGAEAEIGELLGRGRPLVLSPAELAGRFPADGLTPDLLRRARALGLVETTEDGDLRVVDARFLETGATLARLGIPLGVILDEWEALSSLVDQIADRFAALFEAHLLPDRWRDDLDPATAARLAATLATLRSSGEQVLSAALDASLARVAAARFAELLPSEGQDAPATGAQNSVQRSRSTNP